MSPHPWQQDEHVTKWWQVEELYHPKDLVTNLIFQGHIQAREELSHYKLLTIPLYQWLIKAQLVKNFL